MKRKIYFLGSKEIGLDCLTFLYENKDLFSIEIKAVFSNNRMLYKNSTDIKSLSKNDFITNFTNQCSFKNNLFTQENLEDIYDFIQTGDKSKILAYITDVIKDNFSHVRFLR